jgi:transglutaminase-like putative cysteine protease
MIIPISDLVAKQKPEIFDVSKLWYNDIINWIINSQYRQSVNVSYWLKAQMELPDATVQELAGKIQSFKDYDSQMQAIFQWVRDMITYQTDLIIWKMTDYWQTAEKTLKLKTGDCEDGAVLMYILARLKGIPANRLWIWGGNVITGEGHCCLFYKRSNYPWNFVAMDWCYYPSNQDIEEKDMFTLIGKQIIEEDINSNLVESKYLSTWFLFNEKLSTISVVRKQ